MKNRIPPPVLTLFFIGCIWFSDSFFPSAGVSWAAFPFLAALSAVVGLGMLFWAGFLFKRQKTTVNPFRPNKTAAIVATGPYRFTRNPMYLGMILLIISAGLWFQHLSAIPIVFAFWFYITETQIKPEERALVDKFGEEYSVYMKKVRRWV